MRPDPQRLIDRREFPVLYVDDERENLRAFELAFRRDFKIYTADSGSDALALINDLPISVVLSDHRMPGMTGTEFLSRVRTIDPRTVRLLVTAYGDASTLADAVNNGSIYRYIAKPWSPDEMRVAISQAIDLYAVESERESLLAELTALHSVSQDLSRERSLEFLAAIVVEAATERFGFDGASLMVREGDGPRFRVLACRPEDGVVESFLKGFSFECGDETEWVRDAVAGKAQLLRLEDARKYPPWLRGLVTHVSASEILSLPLSASGTLVGVLLVDNRRGGRQFLASERSLLEGLAAQAAIAIENASFIQSLGQAAERDRAVEHLSLLAGPALLMAAGASATTDIVAAIQGLSSLSERREQLSLEWLDEVATSAIAIAKDTSVGAELAFDRQAVGNASKVEIDRASLIVCVALLLVEAAAYAPAKSRIGVVSSSDIVEIRAQTGPAADLAEWPASLRLAAAERLAEQLGVGISVRPEPGQFSISLSVLQAG